MEHANGQKRRRLNETPQQTEMRRAADANRHRRRYVSVAQKRSDYEAAMINIDNLPDDLTDEITENNCGLMSIKCQHCEAYFYKDEKFTRSSIKNPKFGLCCGDGKVKLRAVADPPQNL